jgi:hypothetical protein
VDLSELEQEVELDMEGDYEAPDSESEDSDREWEAIESESDDREWEDESQDLTELESNQESADDREAQDFEWESETDGRDSEYVDRFLEVASREFESESEVDASLNEVLEDVSKEYFFGKIKKGLKKLAKNKLVRGLVQKGLKFAQGQFPALKAVTQLARGNLKGMLLNLGKQALGAAIPGSTAVLGALDNVGLNSESGDVADREVWDNYLQISKDAFETLADNLNEQVDQPLEASRVASQAFRHAMVRAKQRRGGAGRVVVGSPGRGARGPVRRIQLQPGERLVITGVRKLFVKGR